jgi:lysophospholipase L1-like esterase
MQRPVTRTLAATPRLSHRIAAAGFGVALACVVCEIGARMIFPPPPEAARQPQITYRYDPEIRYVMEPSQRGWIDDGLISVNAMGFRGPEVISPKPSGLFRIAVIGDSVTLGWGVADDETFAAQVERHLHGRFPNQSLDVVNLGVGGYDTRQEVTLLKRNLALLEPDLVVVGFYSNDAPDAADDNGGSGAGTAGAGGTRIAVSHPENGQALHMNPTPAAGWNAWLRKSRAIYVVGRAINRVLGKGEWGMARYSMELDILQGRDSPALDQAWKTVATQFGNLRTLADAHGFAVDVVILPCKEQVMGQYPHAKYQSRVRAIVEPLGFTVIDPLPVMAESKTKGELYIPYDRNHPSAFGHRLIAETISQYLDDHIRFPSVSGTIASGGAGSVSPHDR